MILDGELKSSKLTDQEFEASSAIPVTTGICAVNELEAEMNLDAGFCRHDDCASLTVGNFEPRPAVIELKTASNDCCCGAPTDRCDRPGCNGE